MTRPLLTRDWDPMTITLQALSLVEKAGPVQACFTLCLRDHWITWMQDGCKVCMDSYMAWSRSCFMVPWTTFKNHLLEVGLTLNRETMALRTLIMCKDPAWIEIHWNNIWLRARHILLHTMVRCLILEVCWDGLWTLFLGSHNFMVTALGSCVKWP